MLQSPRQCATALDELLRKQCECATTLKDLLAREHTALVDGDTAMLDTTEEGKNQLVKQLEHLQSRQVQLLAGLPFGATETALEQALDWCDNTGHVRPIQQQARLALTECDRDNKRNGLLVQKRLNYVRRAVDELTSLLNTVHKQQLAVRILADASASPEPSLLLAIGQQPRRLVFDAPRDIDAPHFATDRNITALTYMDGDNGGLLRGQPLDISAAGFGALIEKSAPLVVGELVDYSLEIGGVSVSGGLEIRDLATPAQGRFMRLGTNLVKQEPKPQQQLERRAIRGKNKRWRARSLDQ